ncbi:YegJ family protein [Aquabacterium humicola]|uniref:YegJ family protein n=1 Tax=Aquabacterium humicola TaxID=3237377 RepID=UPI002543E47C|nr:DUF2314 domain-containing protein [Rubrivivax pictus]
MLRRLLLSLVAASATTLPAIAQQRDEGEVVIVETGDPEMNSAIKTARASLDEFLRLAASPPAQTSGYKLKVMIRDKDITEHFWVTPFRPKQTGFEGILANDPKLVTTVRNGQQIEFTRGQISDWGYVKNGRQVGSFTICVLFKKMPPEQADYYRKNHGFDC